MTVYTWKRTIESGAEVGDIASHRCDSFCLRFTDRDLLVGAEKG